MPPRPLRAFISRIKRELPGVAVAGVVYEVPRPKTFRERMGRIFRNLAVPAYRSYVLRRLLKALQSRLAAVGSWFLYFIHAYRPEPAPDQDSLNTLNAACEDVGSALFITQDIHGSDVLDFVKKMRPDLGIIYGTRILKPELFTIPTQGSINIHKRKLPDYRGGGPVGLWELLDGQKEIGITVHTVEKAVDAGSILRTATIPIEQYETLSSLGLKAHVVGDDLLLQTIADFVHGSVVATPQQGPSKLFKTPKVHDLENLRRQVARERPGYMPVRGRPTWKLLLRSIVLAPYVAFRNWVRRLRKSFPLVILYHHLVTERPHHVGIPTDLFVRHIKFLRKHYKLVSLSEGLQALKSGGLGAPMVAVSFDDGYRENFLNLRAAAVEVDFSGALFVCSQKLEKQEEFEHDIRRGELGFLPFTWQQLCALSADGFELGSHTRTHFDCGSGDIQALADEIVGSKQELEQRLGVPITLFSFPWGKPANMSESAIRLATANYPSVFSAKGHAIHPNAKLPLVLDRVGHPNDLWELELNLQSILEFD